MRSKSSKSSRKKHRRISTRESTNLQAHTPPGRPVLFSDGRPEKHSKKERLKKGRTHEPGQFQQDQGSDRGHKKRTIRGHKNRTRGVNGTKSYIGALAPPPPPRELKGEVRPD